ncbi:MAG: ComF family protein, partial [Candidatus Velthaea sp.]
MWKAVQPWLFPVECLGCRRSGTALCAGCAPGVVQRETTILGGVAVTALGAYAGLLREAIVAMKRGERAYLDAFAPLVADVLEPDCILVPLPTTRARRAARGFDQAVELARRAAALRGAAVSLLLAKRGAPQRGRDRAARIGIHGRFSAKSGAAPLPAVTLIDDVCTTGATLRDAVAALDAAGIGVREAVVLAQTPPGRNHHRVAAVLA